MGGCVSTKPQQTSLRTTQNQNIPTPVKKPQQVRKPPMASIMDATNGMTLHPKIRQTREKLKPLQLSSAGYRGQMKINWIRIDERCFYKGQWKNDKMHGEGQAFVTSDGTQRLVMALFVDGKVVERKARVIDALGGYYDGPINMFFEPEGRGVYINEDKKLRLSGEFLHGLPHGQGKEQTPQYIFEGIYKNGNKQTGKMTDSRGGVYEGEFKNGQMHGKGQYKWKDGGTYVGYFQNGLKHGKGKLYDSDHHLVRKGNWTYGEMTSIRLDQLSSPDKIN